MRARRGEEEGEAEEETEEPEEEGAEVVACLGHLTIKTMGTQEEAEEGRAAALRMEVEAYRGSEGEEGGWRDSTVTGSP